LYSKTKDLRRSLSLWVCRA